MLLVTHGIIETVYCHIHVVHQEGVDELVEHRTEEALGG